MRDVGGIRSSAGLRWMLKGLHLAGLVLFLGGIAAAVVLGAGHHLGELDAFRTRRLIAADLTRSLIVPGMWLVTVSGAALAWQRGRSLFPKNWLGLKEIAGLAIVINGTFALVPLVERIGKALVVATPDLVEAGRLQGLEDRLGAVNFVLAIGCLVLAVWRPGEERTRVAEQADGLLSR